MDSGSLNVVSFSVRYQFLLLYYNNTNLLITYFFTDKLEQENQNKKIKIIIKMIQKKKKRKRKKKTKDQNTNPLGTISHKKVTNNNFWSQASNQKFYQKILYISWKNINSFLFWFIFGKNCKSWIKITSKMMNKFWSKRRLWPKNVIIQLLQS